MYFTGVKLASLLKCFFFFVEELWNSPGIKWVKGRGVGIRLPGLRNGGLGDVSRDWRAVHCASEHEAEGEVRQNELDKFNLMFGSFKVEVMKIQIKAKRNGLHYLNYPVWFIGLGDGKGVCACVCDWEYARIRTLTHNIVILAVSPQSFRWNITAIKEFVLICWRKMTHFMSFLLVLACFKHCWDTLLAFA